MRIPLDSRQLQVFVSVAKHGSFTRAGREVFLTQSAVSHSMRSLEDELGCRLLNRMGKSVTLTPGGEYLLYHAEKLLSGLETARIGFDQLSKWGQARIRLAAPTTLCTSLVPTVWRNFHERNPECRLIVEPSDSQETLVMLDDDRVDLAFALEPKADDRFEFSPLFSDELQFVVSPEHDWAKAGRSNRDEIAAQRLIVYGKTSQTWRMIDSYFREDEIRLDAVVELRSMEAIKELVKLNLGIGILAAWVAAREIREKTLVALPLGRRKLRRQWGVIHRKSRTLSLVELAFVQFAHVVAKALETEQKSA